MTKHQFEISKQFLEDEYVKNKQTQSDIASKIGCSTTTICELLKKYKIHTRKQYRWTHENHPMYKDQEKFREQSRKNLTETQRKKHEWKNDIQLTQDQKSIIFGSLLGDMSIGMPNTKSKNALIEEEHSIKQIEYLKWKETKLKSIIKHEMTTRHLTTGKKEIDAVRIKSMSLKCLTEICKIVKPNREKEITKTWIDNCDNISLAVWFMDDGTASKREARLHMGNKNDNEILIAMKWLEELGIKSRLNKHELNKKHITITGKSNLINLYNRIKPTVNQIPSMKYKLKFIDAYLERQHFVVT